MGPCFIPIHEATLWLWRPGDRTCCQRFASFCSFCRALMKRRVKRKYMRLSKFQAVGIACSLSFVNKMQRLECGGAVKRCRGLGTYFGRLAITRTSKEIHPPVSNLGSKKLPARTALVIDSHSNVTVLSRSSLRDGPSTNTMAMSTTFQFSQERTGGLSAPLLAFY
ncbi:hypothetical protein M378DRAFT_672872 [Amanita muscaria Koide BX008]|uniref:Uncharacterized protein n=1 Tax=Amanita muscaria (strain Koide BX008) TaxID=946122 RepID=A0A0C2WP96_AMAMK|nr:hypothetical protein M378DRAFT_672872 [Amanita muscaria Koide BX008]